MEQPKYAAVAQYSPEEQEARLEQARGAKAARDEARRLRDGAIELEALELEERFEREIGPRGLAFQLVTTALGTVVVRRADHVAYKRFQAVDGAKLSIEDVQALVAPHVVHPTREEYLATTKDHGGIAWACAKAMIEMFEAKRGVDSGK